MRRLMLGLCLSLMLPVAVYAQASGQGDFRTNLTRLHDELRLTSSQETAWRQYQAAVQPDAQAEARRRSAEQMLPTLKTPRRIALMQSSMASDVADFRRQAAAVIAFYDQLTPDQQKTFDRVTLPPAQGAGQGTR